MKHLIQPAGSIDNEQPSMGVVCFLCEERTHGAQWVELPRSRQMADGAGGSVTHAWLCASDAADATMERAEDGDG